jgi:two-component system sensor histidine kinase KdpD
MLLLVVLFCSTLFGSRAGLAASVAAGLSFNYFFLPPFYTFNISGPENWVAFGAFVITALIAGQLSGYARRRARESEARQAEIERLYNELRAAFEQASEAEGLRRSEKLKSALLDAVTHDLRTPLTSIKASVTTLIDSDKEELLDDESKNELLQIINEETDRLNEFIEGMVGIARLEAGTAPLERRMTSVDEIVSSALGRAAKHTRGHRIETRMNADLPELNVDAAAVTEVLYTLIDNAAKYSPSSTTIRISARQVDESVEIGVEDEGSGIPKDERKRVFDKFYRSRSADIHSTGGGLGLGLAIARGLVEAQGGEIRIEDGSEGFVTKIAFTLPIDATAK